MLRILHVIPALSCTGGIQSWLLAILRFVNRESFRFDFLPKHYDNFAPSDSLEGDFRSLGAQIYRCATVRTAFPSGKQLRSVLRNGYDIVHQHIACEGSILWACKEAGIPVRVIHVHNDISSSLVTGRLPGRLIRRLQVALSKRYATDGLACSSIVGESYFRSKEIPDRRWKMFFHGIDLSAFEGLQDRQRVRCALGIPEKCFVIGHVGRFEEQKNHPFIVRIMSEVFRHDQNVRLLCIGDGSRRNAFVEQLNEAGLKDRVILTGRRRDVPALMMGAMDALLFPSLYEGLGLVLIEAQAAGLPCVISDRIPKEADVVPGLIHRLSLEEPAEVWARTLHQVQKGRDQYLGQEKALLLVKASPFDIRQSAENLERFYTEADGRGKMSSARS